MHTIIALEEDAFIETISDIFCISAEQPLERWRPFVNITDKRTLVPSGWTPQNEHQNLINKRAWQARCVHQYTLLTVLAENWEVYHALCAFRIAALLEMRHTEIALADFQLLCGMIGVDNVVTSKDQLYYAAVCVHSVHLYCHDILAESCKSMKGARKSIVADKASRTDNYIKLVRNLMRQIHQLHLVVPPTLSAIRAANMTDQGNNTQRKMEDVCKRLTMVIKALDDVLSVSPAKDRKFVQV